MGLGSDFLDILKDTVKLTDSVERLNKVNDKIQNQVSEMDKRLVRLETRLDTYVEVAKISQKKRS